MADYEVSARAQLDLLEIWEYTADNWSVEKANSYNMDLQSAFEELATGEMRGRPIEGRERYMRFAVGSHFVIYRERSGGIAVVRILHQRMDIARHLLH